MAVTLAVSGNHLDGGLALHSGPKLFVTDELWLKSDAQFMATFYTQGCHQGAVANTWGAGIWG